MEIEQLISKVIDVAIVVRRKLLPGYLEKVYENALVIELAKNGLDAKQQCPIKVYYDDIVVGDFIADIFVEDKLIIEVKAVQHLNVAHEAQLVNYLNATRVEHGLLINFGSSPKIQIKRKFRDKE